MPKFTTPAGTTQRYIAALDRNAPDSIPGTKKVYTDRAAFLQGVADERACIAMGLPVWFDGIDLQVMSEPLGAKRLWSLATSAGSAAANAAASHGRTAVIGAFVKVLSSDSSRILSTNGAPASGLGDNGDMAWDQVAGIVYEKASGAWSILVSMYGSGGSSPVAPGAVQNLAAGTATTNAQPLSWQAPATGTGPFTYQVAFRLGTSTGAYTNFGSPVSGLSATVTGLSAGTAYDYQVTAINAAGTGPAATINDASTAAGATVPGAPGAPVATAGDGTVSATWTAPTSNGGSPVTDYRLRWNGGTPVEMGDADLNGVIAAANGTPGTLEVAARNAIGWGPYSPASNSVTPTASAPALRTSAPFDAQLSGVQNNSTNTARISCGNVNLGNANGDDWTLTIQTEWRDTNVNKGGGLLSIGNQADNLQTAAGNLALWVNGSGTSTGNPWSTDNAYAGTVMLSAQDDENNTVTSRKVISDMLPGALRPYPLVGKAGVVAQPGSASHMIAVTCRAGTIELWDVDPVNGAFKLDWGPGLTSSRADGTRGYWKTIQNKPLYLGFLNLVTQTPRTYWGGPLGQCVLWNGGAMSPEQLVMLAQGIDARDVVTFDAGRGDRYWPGSSIGGQLEELIAGQHGTVEGVGGSFISTARVQTADAGVTLEWRDGVIFTADPSPATTSTVRAWGSRRGNASEVQVRILSATAASPAAGGDVLVDWVSMTGTAPGRWAGDIPGVPHAVGVLFKAETRYKLVDGSWSNPFRAHGTFGCGVGALALGQSIVSKLMQMSGSSRSLAAGSVGKITSYDMFMPIGTINRIPANNTTGWQNRNAAAYAIKWGQTVAADLLTQMTGQRSFFIDLSIEGIDIARYNDTGSTWARVLQVMHEARPKYIIWNQGHGDLEGATQAGRSAALTKLLNQFKAAAQSAPGGAFDFKFLVIPVGSDWVDQLNSMRSFDMVWARAAAAAGEPVKLFTDITEQPNDGDMIHPAATSADMGCMSERIATGLAFEQGYSAQDAIGGELGNGTWSWAGGTLTVDIPITGGSGSYATRAGGNPSGFRLQLSGGGSVLPTTSALLTGPNRVRLTYDVASAPTSVSFTYLSGYPGTVGNGTKPTLAESGIENCLYDVRTSANPRVSGLPGMPFLSVPSALTVAPA